MALPFLDETQRACWRISMMACTPVPPTRSSSNFLLLSVASRNWRIMSTMVRARRCGSLIWLMMAVEQRMLSTAKYDLLPVANARR